MHLEICYIIICPPFLHLFSKYPICFPFLRVIVDYDILRHYSTLKVLYGDSITAAEDQNTFTGMLLKSK